VVGLAVVHGPAAVVVGAVIAVVEIAGGRNPQSGWP
jgi:hypothetical protein